MITEYSKWLFPEIKLEIPHIEAPEPVRADVPKDKLIDPDWIDRAFQPVKLTS